MLKFCCALAVALLATACTTTTGTSPPPASAKPAVATLADLKFTELKPRAEQSVTVDSASQLVAFPEGSSYVAAFALPPLADSQRLLVKSYLFSTWLPSAEPTVYYPSFVFLDADRKPLRGPVRVGVNRDSSVLKGGFYYAVVQTKPEDRFVVIYADPRAYGHKIPLVGGGAQAMTHVPENGIPVSAIIGPPTGHQVPMVGTGTLGVTLLIY